MFYECMMAGAKLGVKAFFAVLVFLLCCAAILCITAWIVALVKLITNGAEGKV